MPAPRPSLNPGYKPDENAICPGQSCPFSFFKPISAGRPAQFPLHIMRISAAYLARSSPQLVLRTSAA